MRLVEFNGFLKMKKRKSADKKKLSFFASFAMALLFVFLFNNLILILGTSIRSVFLISLPSNLWRFFYMKQKM